MSGAGSDSAPAAAASAPAAHDDDSPSPAAPLLLAFSQRLHAVECAEGSGAGGAEVAAARREALSSLWQWLHATRAQAEAGEGAARRLILLYRSVTADQVSLLCNVIRKATVDGMEDEVSQRRAGRSDAAESQRKKWRLGWLLCWLNGLIEIHSLLRDADCMGRHSPAPASAALW